MIDISLYIPLLTKAFLSCVLGQPAKLRRGFSTKAEIKRSSRKRKVIFNSFLKGKDFDTLFLIP